MFRASALRLRTPMIRFKYAEAKNGGKPFVWPALAAAARPASAAAAPAAAAVEARPGVYNTDDELPPHLRRRLLSEVEIEMVLAGGAPPYVPKHLQKKKKA